MRPTPVHFRLLALAVLIVAPVQTARAQQARVLSSDARGVTLRLDLPAWKLGPAGTDGRSEIVLPGFDGVSLPGRPHLPSAKALIALPPGAGAVARVVSGSDEEVREGVRVAIGARPVMRDDRFGLGPVPGLEPVDPILDGSWPVTPVEVGAPFTVRRQRMVAVQMHPFRYDESSHRLWARRSLVVRVDFTGAAAPEGGAAGAAGVGAPDRHWDPVFQSALANDAQARAWRGPAPFGPAPRLDRASLPAALRPLAALEVSDPEVRVQADTSGVYVLDYDDLAANGYPAGVPIAEVSLHRHEYVGPVDPPYVTIEIPIEVNDWNANGVFDSGDEIVAWLENWTDRSGITSYIARDWGDGDDFYATRIAGGAGLRLPTRPGWRDAVGLPPLASYPWTQRWERNFQSNLYPSPPDTAVTDRFTWTAIFAYYSRPDSFRFETNHLDTTHAVTFRTFLQPSNASPHVMFARIKNGLSQFTQVVDSLTWFDKLPRTVATVLPGSVFTEGRTNTLALWGKNSIAPPDPVANAFCNVGLNAFEAVYWRATRALRGYLDLNSADATDLFQVHAVGFTSTNVRAYDVTDPTQPVRLALDPSHIVPTGGGQYALDFQDSVDAAGARRYVVFDQAKLLPPERYHAVTRYHLTSTADEKDWIVIAPEAFLPAAQRLAAFRRDTLGMSVFVAPLEGVNDEFNGGRTSKYAIKRFLRFAYERWNAKFVLLLGDGSADGRRVLNTAGPDWIPVSMIPGPVSSGLLGLEMIPCDPWYGWCLNEDPTCVTAGPPEPDLFVGRLPVNSLAEANAVVGKVIRYETFGGDETWRRRVLLLADDAYSGQTTFGNGTTNNSYCFKDYEQFFLYLNQACQLAIADTSGLALTQPTVMDLRTYLDVPSLYQVNGPGDTCRVGSPTGEAFAENILRAQGFQQALFDTLNQGVLWWNYQGHANAFVLAHEGFYRSQQGQEPDVQKFQNPGREFLFSAFSCHANAFAYDTEDDGQSGPSIGEGLVNALNGGAIASYASTGFEVVPQDPSYHLNVELARALFLRPPHDDELGKGSADHGARAPVGEVVALTLLQYLPVVAQSSLERGVGLTYNLLGDPATRLWVGPVQIVVTANGQPVTSGQPVTLATGGDTLRLEADVASNAEITTLALDRQDETGTSTVDPSLYTVTPPFPDTLPGGQGGRRYHLSYETDLRAGPLRYTLRTVDRYGVASRFDVVFEFRTQLFSGGNPIQDGDLVAPDAALGLLVLSPTVVPPESLQLTVDGLPQGFRADTVRGDVTGRQLMLTWTHAPYANGSHVVVLLAPGNQHATHRFTVAIRFALENPLAFPNPFDDDLGTRFVFTLSGGSPADVLLRVFTVSGRMIYEARASGLSPGYHEIVWNGRDAEGSRLANGVYFYKLTAHGADGTRHYDGRLVKLRKPRRAPDQTAGSGGP